MNTKKLWTMLAIALVSLCTVGCGGDDDDDMSPNKENNGGTTEVTTDYTATTSIKTIVVGVMREIYSGAYSNGFVFYQDYNNRYWIGEANGEFYVSHEVRANGGWADYNGYINDGPWTEVVSQHVLECGMKDYGKVAGISKILSKENLNGAGRESPYLRYRLGFLPNHGYAVMFTTENGEEKYMRVYAKDYKLDSNGNLESVTIQYQLY